MAVDTQQLLEEISSLAGPEADKSLKISQAEKKRLLLDVLTTAIPAGDVEAAKEALELYKVPLPQAPMRTLILQNYNDEIASLLLEHGLKIEGNLQNFGTEATSPDALRFLLSLPIAQNERSFVQEEYNKLKTDHEKNQYEFHHSDFSYGVSWLYQQLPQGAVSAKDKERGAEMRGVILEKFPNLVDILAKNSGSWFLRSRLGDYKYMKKDWQKIKRESWRYVLSSLNGFNHFNAKEATNFFKLLGDFNLGKEFEQTIQKIEERRNIIQAISEEWFSGETLFDTKLYQAIKDVPFSKSQAGYPSVMLLGGTTQGVNTMGDWLENIIKDTHHPVTYGSSLEQKITFVLSYSLRYNPLAQQEIGKLFDIDILTYANETTPWEEFLGNPHVAPLLSRTPTGRNIILKNLTPKGLANISSLNCTAFRQVWENVPELSKWRDDKNNNLLHLAASNNTSKLAGDTFMRLSKEMFSEPNNDGKSPLEIMKLSGMKESVFASLQKALMGKTLRGSKTEGGTKIRARKKHSSTPRRM